MKTVILFFITQFCFSQNINVAIGGDIANCLQGSKPTLHKPKADVLLKVYVTKNNTVAGIGLERFAFLDYTKIFIEVGQELILQENVTLSWTLEPTLINRQNNWGNGISIDENKTFATIGGSLMLKRTIYRKLSFAVQSNLLYRKDLVSKYNENQAVKISVYAMIILEVL